MNKNLLYIIVIVITVIAVMQFGSAGLSALLGLFIPTGKNSKRKAEQVLSEAIVHEELAKHEVEQAVIHKNQVEKVNDEMEAVRNKPVDKTKPVSEVVKSVHKDLN